MNAKILPIKEPVLNGYPDYAIFLSIIANYESTKDWMYTNFVQLFFDPGAKYNKLRFFYTDNRGKLFNVLNPWFEYQMINKSTVDSCKIDCIDFVVDAINSNQYVIAHVNEYYIPAAFGYNNYSNSHKMFIYGYDSNEHFYIQGYLRESGQYSTSTIKFSDFKLAYENNHCNSDRKMYFLTFDDKKEYPFNKDAFIEQLEYYLYAKDSSLKLQEHLNPMNHLKFGIDIYTELKKLFDPDHIEEWFVENNMLNVKPVHVLWEHKKFMLERMKYLGAKGTLLNWVYYYNNFEDIEQHAFLIKNKLMKYGITKQVALLAEITQLITVIEKKEIELITELLNEAYRM